MLAALLLFAVWAPSNIGAKSTAQENACRANLRQIDSAVNRWALEHEKKATNSYSFTEPVLLSYLKGSALPTCPTGGHYSPGATVTNAPKCSLAAKGHTLYYPDPTPMDYFAQDLPLLLILAAPVVAGCFAWSRGARKTACGLWAVALVLVVGLTRPWESIGGGQTARKNSCIANLKQIDGAVQQWALENNKKAADLYSFGDKSLLAYMRGSVLPECPQGGRYTAGANVGDLPKCSLAAKGHTL